MVVCMMRGSLVLGIILFFLFDCSLLFFASWLLPGSFVERRDTNHHLVYYHLVHNLGHCVCWCSSLLCDHRCCVHLHFSRVYTCLLLSCPVQPPGLDVLCTVLTAFLVGLPPVLARSMSSASGLELSIVVLRWYCLSADFGAG